MLFRHVKAMTMVSAAVSDVREMMVTGQRCVSTDNEDARYRLLLSMVRISVSRQSFR